MAVNVWTATVPMEQALSGLARVRSRHGVPDGFPPAVLQAALDAVAAHRHGPADLTDVDFVTLDPAASTDLDQAFHISPHAAGGFRVRYAIADVPSFVAIGGSSQSTV